MVEVISTLISFVFIAFLLFISFKFFDKERKEQLKFRRDFINALNNIANVLRSE